jgi:TonB family protein
MPPITKENETLLAPPESSARTAPAAVLPGDTTAKAQPVALEVAVTVNGARTVEGSDKREPFSESTKTVLVFGTGAVIRLSSSVAPGQLLFLTNERTKKEVVCQVVKSKNYRNVSGYVELEFTEQVVGFWGMRFPTDRLGSGPQVSGSSPSAAGSNGAQRMPTAPRPPAPRVEAPAASLTSKNFDSKPVSVAPVARHPEPKLSESKFVIPTTPSHDVPASSKALAPLTPVAPAAPIANSTPTSLMPEFNLNSVPLKSNAPIPSAFDSPRAPESKASIFAPPPQASAAHPTVNVSSLSADSDLPPIVEAKAVPPHAPQLPQVPLAHTPIASDPETEALKQHTARLQEQLSSMLFSETSPAKRAEKPPAPAIKEIPVVADAASNVLEFVQPNPEPAAVKPVESSKVAPPPVRTSLDSEALKIPSWLEPLARNASAPASTQELIEREKARRLAQQQPKIEEIISEVYGSPEEGNVQEELPAPPFIIEPSLDEEHVNVESRTQSSGTGVWIGAIASVVLLSAAGAWWFLRPQPKGVAASAAAIKTSSAAPAASAPAESLQPQPVNSLPAQNGSKSVAEPISQSGPAQNSAMIGSAAGSNVAVHNASEKSASNSAKSNNGTVTAATLPPAAAEPEPKKPVLGEVRLATPTVTRHRNTPDNGDADPGAALAEDQPDSNNEALGAGLSVNTNQPSAPQAPVAVGGDVKTAKLITSVAPVYPMLAKNQHVSGNVQVDAFIDATGHVTTMKVVSGPTLLHQAAMDALKQWKYQPATLDGKPVSMHLTVSIQFRLQ